MKPRVFFCLKPNDADVSKNVIILYVEIRITEKKLILTDTDIFTVQSVQPKIRDVFPRTISPVLQTVENIRYVHVSFS